MKSIVADVLPAISSPTTDERLISTDSSIATTSKTGKSIIYDGNKYFWRTRSNVEVKIIDHPSVNCLEVVNFNIDAYAESSRIYLDKALLYSRLNKEDIDVKVSAKREEYTRQRKRVANEEIVEQIQKELVSAYVLARLSIVSNGGSDRIALMPLSGDALIVDKVISRITLEDNTESEVMEEISRLDLQFVVPPTALEPYFVPRRRKTTASDFQNTLDELRTDAASLNSAMKTAQKAAGLMVSSVEGFQHNMQRQRFTYDPESTSIAKIRWAKAGRRVILQNTVQNIRIRLERYSLSALETDTITASAKAMKSSRASSSQLPSLLSGRTMPAISEGLSSSKTAQKLPTLTKTMTAKSMKKQ